MTGRSLKEESLLWEGFKNLKATRNSFVHGGVAKLGNKSTSLTDALQLIGRAEEIITKIREWIPEDCQWPVFKHEMKFKISKILIKNENPSINTETPQDGQ